MNISESPEEPSPVAAENAPPNTWTDEEETGDEEPGEEGFREENTSFSNTEDEFTEFDSSISCDEMEADLALDSSKKSYAERARIFKLRRNLDQLDSFYKQKEHDVLKAREELKACRLSISELEMRRDMVERDIGQQKEVDNTAAVFRLRAQHKRLCAELLAEEDLESHIAQDLKAHELELCQVEVEKGRFSPLRQEVEQEEQVLEANRARRAACRLEQEDAVARRVRLRRQLERRKQRDLVKEEEERSRKAAEEALVSRQRASVYFKETMSRIRQKEAEKELQSRETMDRRMQAVLSLKSSITATQEKLRAKRARDKAYLLRQEEEEEEEGGETRTTEQQRAEDIGRHKHRQKRLQDSQKKKELFVEQQKSKKVEIISRVSQEDTLHEKHKKPHSLLFPPTPPRLKKTSGLDTSAETLIQDAERAPAKPARLRPDWRTPSPMSDEDSQSSEDASSPGVGNLRSEDEEEKEEEECLALPEFIGLWDLKHREYKDLHDDEVSICTTAREGLTLTQGKHLSALLRRKAMQGKEFKGCPFVSKPEFIHFKDFEVGKTYKKKITLTNVTYSINYCKLLGITEHLKDFISIHFEPPGPMSSGMACDMTATFKPMINKDLDGEVQFSSAAGPFYVPLKCTIKTCSPAIDCSLIDFGTHVVGETISRTITLTNQGAVGTHFILVPSACSEPQQAFSTPYSLDAQVTPQDNSNPGAVLDEVESAGQQESGESKPEEKTSKLSAGVDCPSTVIKQAVAADSSVRCQTPVSPELIGPEPSSKSTSSEQIGAEMQQSSKEDTQDSCDIKAGEGREGQIGPFGCVKLHIVFTPTVLGEVKMDFHIKFSDPDSQPIPVAVRGVGICVPVWVAEPNIDLKICMFERLYQDSIVVQSRSNTALRLTFEVCKELRNHMEVLPKTGYIQAKSSFNAQLKFLPRSSLPEDAESFFDRETGVLEVPMSIQVADQVRPVTFTVNAIITTSQLEFDRTELDFGHCSIFESVKTSVLLRNHSLLPQDFGFLGIPEFVDIQPNDGFGTLLPLESLEIDVIFSPKQAAEYKFQLSCKSGINRDFKLSCCAVGVLPPLELSHSLVQFGATAAGDESTAVLHVVNSHTSHNQFTRPPPRIGKGAASPVGPKLFEFALPETSEINITPTTGRVLPGQRCLVQVSFRPTVSDEAVREEALRLLCQAEEQRVKQEQERAEKQKELDDLSKKDAQLDSKRGKNQQSRLSSAKPSLKERGSKSSPTPKISSPFRPPHPSDIQQDSDEFAAGKTSLLLSFPQRFSRYVIPCFLSNGDATDRPLPKDLQFSPHNTLYLELYCPAVRPALVVISNKGRRTLNFQQVAVGQRVIQKVTIQNISQESLELASSLLDLSGPFVILNPLRPLEPQATHTISLSFSPALAKKYRETLDLKSAKMSLRLTLCGIGVHPAVSCSHEGTVMDFGYVLATESASQVFKLQNTSTLQVRFRVHLDSLSLTRQQEQEQLPVYLAYGTQLQSTVGTQNYSGLSVFSVVPVEGAIPPGKTQDVNVTFQPDHESLNYSDRLTVELMNKKTVCAFDLKGAARLHTMFLCGGDPLDVPVESLATLPPSSDPEFADAERAPLPVLLTLRGVCGESGVLPAVRELEVGCIRCSLPAAKKNVEFSWDGLPSLQHWGLSVEPARGTVEPGTKRSITVTWAPPSGFSPKEVVRTSAQLTLKGDDTEVYSVTLLAMLEKAPQLEQLALHPLTGKTPGPASPTLATVS